MKTLLKIKNLLLFKQVIKIFMKKQQLLVLRKKLLYKYYKLKMQLTIIYLDY